jgi:lipoprotein-anchoring transpeptidase ErfK/SrfK
MKTFILMLMVAVGGGVGYKYQDQIFDKLENGEIVKESAGDFVATDPFKKARQAVVDDDLITAIGLYEELIATTENKAQAVKELSAFYIKKKKLAEAYTLQYENAANSKEASQIYLKIAAMSARTMNKSEYEFNGERYIIQKGDSLAKIAKKHGSTPLLLQAVNKIKVAHRIRERQAIKIVKTNPKIVVSLSKKKLLHYQNGTLFKVYDVGVGKVETPTPTREYEITIMQIDPPWYKTPGKDPIPGDDPRNGLGSRWMGFEGDYTSFGIHGTNQPKSVGKASSNGCVRMLNNDVNDLFLFCQIGTKVKIIK